MTMGLGAGAPDFPDAFFSSGLLVAVELESEVFGVLLLHAPKTRRKPTASHRNAVFARMPAPCSKKEFEVEGPEPLGARLF
jgi:hypothetical protein